jgi:hypothetical protein
MSTIQGSKLQLDLSTLQWPVLHLDVRVYRLYELVVVVLQDVSTLQRPVVQLDLSTLQWPVLHLDVSRLHELVVLQYVSTPQGPELHLDAPVQQEPVLLLDVNFAFLKSWMFPLECMRRIFCTKIYLKNLFCRWRLGIILSYYLLMSHKHSIVDLDDDSHMLIMKHLIFMKY